MITSQALFPYSVFFSYICRVDLLLFSLFPVSYVLFQRWMLILNTGYDSDNKLSICAGNHGEPKAQLSDCSKHSNIIYIFMFLALYDVDEGGYY